MSYCNCKKCNKIFNYIKGPMLCNICDEEVLNQIKTYLYENPKATASDINLELNIPIKIIKEYIKDKRLMYLRSETVNLCCLCGDIINDDVKYCEKCLKKIKLVNEMNDLNNNKGKVHNKVKMHYLDNERIRKR